MEQATMFNPSNILYGLALSALGSLITVWYGHFVDYLRARRGEFTGEWEQIIPAFEGEPEKRATVRIRHIGDKIHAVTRRTSPVADFVQRWDVEGRVKRGLMFGIYWPQDSSKLPGSYGTLQFKVVSEVLLEGFYVRAREERTDGAVTFAERLKSIPIRWERKIPRRSRKNK